MMSFLTHSAATYSFLLLLFPPLFFQIFVQPAPQTQTECKTRKTFSCHTKTNGEPVSADKASFFFYFRSLHAFRAQNYFLEGIHIKQNLLQKFKTFSAIV